MCLARPKFPVLFSLRVFLGQVFSGHPGKPTRSFNLITFDEAMFIFCLSLKWVGLWRYSQAISNILQCLLVIFASCFSINFW